MNNDLLLKFSKWITDGLPSVRVPVLSKTTVLIKCDFSNIDELIAEQMDVGQSTINYHRMNSLKEMEEFLEVHKDDI